VSVLFNN